MSRGVPRSTMGELVTATTGEQYYIIGKNRIKITEHFPANGKRIEDLITDLISDKIKEKVAKIS